MLGYPCYGRVIEQFLKLRLGGHMPTTAPVGRGCIVPWKKSGQIVGEAVIAAVGHVAVLGEGITVAVAVSVGAPVVSILGLGFTPSEVVAVVFRVGGTHIAGCPQQAARNEPPSFSFSSISFNCDIYLVFISKKVARRWPWCALPCAPPSANFFIPCPSCT